MIVVCAVNVKSNGTNATKRLATASKLRVLGMQTEFIRCTIITLKIAQGHYVTNGDVLSLPIGVCCNNVSISHLFQDVTTVCMAACYLCKVLQLGYSQLTL